MERKENKERFAAEAEFAAKIEREPILAFLPLLYDKFPEAEFYLVGGAVRDHLVGRAEVKDYDLVVRKVGLEELSEALGELGKVDLVGRNFGVLKFSAADLDPELGAEPVDIAWPRTETSGGSGGYRDFAVQADPELPLEQDLGRRDFTMNAMAWDLKLQRFVDPYGGREDIASKVLKAVGQPAERFQEDYSRMLRAIRQSCQLGFEIEPETWETIKRLAGHLDDEREVEIEGEERSERVVPYETVSKELLKALEADPVRALEMFEQSGLLFRLMPELEPLQRCEQSPDMHSEGDAWAHTKLAVSKLASPEFTRLFPDQRASAETVMAVLLHDVAKPQTVGEHEEEGRITFYGHEDEGAKVAAAVAERLKLSNYAPAGVKTERLAWLVGKHMMPNLLDLSTVRKTTLVKTFLKDPRAGQELLQVAFADAAASIPESGEPHLDNLRQLMEELEALAQQQQLEAGRPAKLLSGHEVMELTGLAPGPEVGRLLNELQEAQLRGLVNTAEEARRFVKKLESTKPPAEE